MSAGSGDGGPRPRKGGGSSVGRSLGLKARSTGGNSSSSSSISRKGAEGQDIPPPPPVLQAKSSLPRLVRRQGGGDTDARPVAPAPALATSTPVLAVPGAAKRKAGKASLTIDISKTLVIKKDAVQSPTGSMVVIKDPPSGSQASLQGPGKQAKRTTKKAGRGGRKQQQQQQDSASSASSPDLTGANSAATGSTAESAGSHDDNLPSMRRSSLTQFYQSVVAIGSKISASLSLLNPAILRKRYSGSGPSSAGPATISTSKSVLSMSSGGAPNDSSNISSLPLAKGSKEVSSTPTSPSPASPALPAKKSKWLAVEGRPAVAAPTVIVPAVPLATEESEIITTVPEGKRGSTPSTSSPERPNLDQYFFIRNMLPPRTALPPVNPATLILPRKTRSSPPITLVLDLDETLVHCSTSHLPNHDIAFTVDFEGLSYHVQGRLRPFHQEFLCRVSRLFEVVLFTASQKKYAEECLKYVDPEQQFIRHRLYRDSCLFVTGGYVKDLEALGRDLAKTIIVDNSPQAFAYHLSNGIPIKSWYEDQTDVELMAVLEFLESIVDVEDVRPHIRAKYNLEAIIFPNSMA